MDSCERVWAVGPVACRVLVSLFVGVESAAVEVHRTKATNHSAQTIVHGFDAFCF
jgi:hypothetical protein